MFEVNLPFNSEEMERLIHAVEIILNSESNSSARSSALTLCEQCKSSRQCTAIGFHLACQSALPPHVRYFGWQLVKHRVRFKWTESCDDEKKLIKEQLVNFIAARPDSEPRFVKNLVSSIFVELAKHVWPQCWPNMLEELFNLCSRDNYAATEIVESMLQGLVEDVVFFQNVAVRSRARDLRQALTAASLDIVQFLNKTLNQLGTCGPNLSSANEQLFYSTLSTVTAFAEWADLKVFFSSADSLIYVLYELAGSEALQSPVMDCLIAIAQRKGVSSERELIVSLADNVFVDKIAGLISKAPDTCNDRYNFLKKVAIMTSSLAGHIVWVWVETENGLEKVKANCLAEKEKFFNLLYFLANCESRVVACPVITSWTNFLRRKEVRCNALFVRVVPKLVQLVSRHLCKDYTEKGISPVEELDFNDDDEILSFMKSFRSACIDLLRCCTCTSPIEVVRLCFETVFKEISVLDGSTGDFARWEGLMTYLETVVGSVVKAAEDKSEKSLLPVEEAVQLLRLFLNKSSTKVADAASTKLYMNCAFSLLNLTALSADPRPEFKFLFDCIFDLLDRTAQQYDNVKIMSLRRQLGSITIRVARDHAPICLALVNYFRSLVLERLKDSSNVLSPLEKATMLESLVLISNEQKCFRVQSQLIADVMATTASITRSDWFVACLQSTESFASYIGLRSGPADGDEEEAAHLRRNISYYIAITLGVVTRSQAPRDRDQLVSGGFCGDDGSILHPCTEHVCGAVDHILSLIRQMSIMWSSEMRQLVAEAKKRALDMKDSEKAGLLSLSPEKSPTAEEVTKQPWQRIQSFLVHNLDSAYQVVGLATKVLGVRFYAVPSLREVVVDRVLSSLDFLPELRLKMLMRHFLTNVLKNCPPSRFADVASPILSTFSDVIMNRIRPLWESYAKQEAERLAVVGNGSLDRDFDDEEDRPEDEIVKEQLLRTLTRDYIEFLVTLCVNKNPPTAKTLQAEGKGSSDAVMSSQSCSCHLTAFGCSVLGNPVCEKVLVSGLVALSWHDTACCHKAAQLLGPLLKQLIQEHGSVFNEDVVKFVFEAVLRGLNRHGQHDGCEAQLSSLALLVIDGLHQRFDSAFADVFAAALPNVALEKTAQFLSNFNQTSDRQRKVTFKNLVSGIIKQHIGQQFREQQRMDVLGPLFVKRRPGKKKVNDEVSYKGIANLFEPDS